MGSIAGDVPVDIVYTHWSLKILAWDSLRTFDLEIAVCRFISTVLLTSHGRERDESELQKGKRKDQKKFLRCVEVICSHFVLLKHLSTIIA